MPPQDFTVSVEGYRLPLTYSLLSPTPPHPSPFTPPPPPSVSRHSRPPCYCLTTRNMRQWLTHTVCLALIPGSCTSISSASTAACRDGPSGPLERPTAVDDDDFVACSTSTLSISCISSITSAYRTQPVPAYCQCLVYVKPRYIELG